ncbi:hypothetical protein JKP88DRAFT_254879 [Tribonema minus]|uniref:Uncharacterized protein n=1 Tax=Tribonema minus TaxID=303371 RepID=A0A835Z153_9STRA|nr:hypothetical protein JKP88DRAFT_254879 [Tribonema minus]
MAQQMELLPLQLQGCCLFSCLCPHFMHAPRMRTLSFQTAQSSRTSMPNDERRTRLDAVLDSARDRFSDFMWERLDTVRAALAEQDICEVRTFQTLSHEALRSVPGVTAGLAAALKFAFPPYLRTSMAADDRRNRLDALLDSAREHFSDTKWQALDDRVRTALAEQGMCEASDFRYDFITIQVLTSISGVTIGLAQALKAAFSVEMTSRGSNAICSSQEKYLTAVDGPCGAQLAAGVQIGCNYTLAFCMPLLLKLSMPPKVFLKVVQQFLQGCNADWLTAGRQTSTPGSSSSSSLIGWLLTSMSHWVPRRLPVQAKSVIPRTDDPKAPRWSWLPHYTRRSFQTHHVRKKACIGTGRHPVTNAPVCGNSPRWPIIEDWDRLVARIMQLACADLALQLPSALKTALSKASGVMLNLQSTLCLECLVSRPGSYAVQQVGQIKTFLESDAYTPRRAGDEPGKPNLDDLQRRMKHNITSGNNMGHERKAAAFKHLFEIQGFEQGLRAIGLAPGRADNAAEGWLLETVVSADNFTDVDGIYWLSEANIQDLKEALCPHFRRDGEHFRHLQAKLHLAEAFLTLAAAADKVWLTIICDCTPSNAPLKAVQTGLARLIASAPRNRHYLRPGRRAPAWQQSRLAPGTSLLSLLIRVNVQLENPAAIAAALRQNIVDEIQRRARTTCAGFEVDCAIAHEEHGFCAVSGGVRKVKLLVVQLSPPDVSLTTYAAWARPCIAAVTAAVSSSAPHAIVRPGEPGAVFRNGGGGSVMGGIFKKRAIDAVNREGVAADSEPARAYPCFPMGQNDLLCIAGNIAQLPPTDAVPPQMALCTLPALPVQAKVRVRVTEISMHMGFKYTSDDVTKKQHQLQVLGRWVEQGPSQSRFFTGFFPDIVPELQRQDVVQLYNDAGRVQERRAQTYFILNHHGVRRLLDRGVLQEWATLEDCAREIIRQAATLREQLPVVCDIYSAGLGPGLQIEYNYTLAFYKLLLPVELGIRPALSKRHYTRRSFGVAIGVHINNAEEPEVMIVAAHAVLPLEPRPDERLWEPNPLYLTSQARASIAAGAPVAGHAVDGVRRKGAGSLSATALNGYHMSGTAMDNVVWHRGGSSNPATVLQLLVAIARVAVTQ